MQGKRDRSSDLLRGWLIGKKDGGEGMADGQNVLRDWVIRIATVVTSKRERCECVRTCGSPDLVLSIHLPTLPAWGPGCLLQQRLQASKLHSYAKPGEAYYTPCLARQLSAEIYLFL